MQGLGDILLRTRAKRLFNVDVCHGTSEVGLLLLAITHHHHLVEVGLVGLKGDLHVRRGFPQHGLVAKECHLDSGVVPYFQGEFSVKVSDGTTVSACLLNGRARHGVTILIHDFTCHGVAFLTDCQRVRGCLNVVRSNPTGQHQCS